MAKNMPKKSKGAKSKKRTASPKKSSKAAAPKKASTRKPAKPASSSRTAAAPGSTDIRQAYKSVLLADYLGESKTRTGRRSR